MSRTTTTKKKPTTKCAKADAPIPYTPTAEQYDRIGRDRDLAVLGKAILDTWRKAEDPTDGGGKFRKLVSDRITDTAGNMSRPDAILYCATGLTATRAHVLAKVTPAIGDGNSDGGEFLEDLRRKGRRLYEDFDLAVYVKDDDADEEDRELDVVYAVTRHRHGGEITAHVLGRIDNDGKFEGDYMTLLADEFRRPWDTKVSA